MRRSGLRRPRRPGRAARCSPSRARRVGFGVSWGWPWRPDGPRWEGRAMRAWRRACGGAGGTRPGGEPRLVQPDAAGLDHAAPEILHLLLHGEHVVAIEIQDVVAAGEDELAHRRRVQRLLERAAQPRQRLGRRAGRRVQPGPAVQRQRGIASSFRVGTSGASVTRASLLAAMATVLPDFTCGRAEDGVSNSRSMVPPIRSACAAAGPL